MKKTGPFEIEFNQYGSGEPARKDKNDYQRADDNVEALF
jgi:hypothetical protein